MEAPQDASGDPAAAGQVFPAHFLLILSKQLRRAARVIMRLANLTISILGNINARQSAKLIVRTGNDDAAASILAATAGHACRAIMRAAYRLWHETLCLGTVTTVGGKRLTFALPAVGGVGDQHLVGQRPGRRESMRRPAVG